MLGKRKPEELSVAELEKLLLVKRRESRLERFKRLSGEGYAATTALLSDDIAIVSPVTVPEADKPALSATGFQPATVQPLGRFGQSKKNNQTQKRSRSKKIRDALSFPK